MRASWISIVITGIIIVSCTEKASGNEEREEDNEWLTQYRKSLWDVDVDFSEVDLNGSPQDAAWHAISGLTTDLHHRITTLYEKATTRECRQLIAKHFGYFFKSIATERPLPFTNIKFDNTCEEEEEYDFDNLPPGIHMGIIQNRTYQPPREEATYISPSEIVFCYGVLAHDSAAATIRLIEAVSEPSTHFVVHVDAKFEETHRSLKEYASNESRITILDHPNRVRVNWGGFSMVNATLQVLKYAEQIQFTHFVHIAATAYPIASNRRIRNTLADYPVDANFLHIVLKPVRPALQVWNYFVECDDRLNRIYELPPLRKETHGADLYTASQWFIISKEFATYISNPEPGSFVHQYLDYIKHAVVADEHFFGTVLRNSHFCEKHHNWNFLHLQFDQWENERAIKVRDDFKCVMPDPNHCGRSPTTMTLDYLDILELSGDLFARKFNDDVDQRIKDVIDEHRKVEEFEITSLNIDKPRSTTTNYPLNLEGHGTLFVAKDTMHTSVPLCMGLGAERNYVRLIPCFYDGVPETLAHDWHTGAVIMDETVPHNRWEIGPCSSDGGLNKPFDGQVEVQPGLINPTGPRCTIKQMDGLRTGRCLDGESFDPQPGGPVHVYPCSKRWHQFLSFGNGKDAPIGSLHTTVPLHTRRRIAETGREQEAYMCLGVPGRGELDEEDWLGRREDYYYHESESEDGSGDENGSMVDEIDQDNFSGDGDDFNEEEETHSESEDGLRHLSHWEGDQLIATRCSNVGAVIEWVLVPFIEEEDSTVVYEDGDNATEDGTAHDEDEEEEL